MGKGLRGYIDRQLNLIEELRDHQFFQSLNDIDWNQYQVVPIVVSSILINLLELSTPLYINLLYTTVLPAKALASLTILTIAVIALLSISGWLRTVRTGLTGFDAARVEHQRRIEAVTHFTQMRLSDYRKEPPSTHAERLNSINLLRDESAIEAFTTAIDLAFSLLFVLVLFLIGGSVGLIALLAITIYFLQSLRFARDFEADSRKKDQLELERVNYQSQLMSSIDLIKSNGLGRFFLIGNEERQERLAWQRMQCNNATGQYQAFSSLMNQATMAALVTWGSFMVITGHLLLGALAACLLLGGKILQPWQQALDLWSNYRRLIHARDALVMLMALPVEPAGGNADLAVAESLRISINGQPLPPIAAGEAVIVRDANTGADARHLFLSLLQIETGLDLSVNGLPVADYNRERLRREVIYVDPARKFYDGSLLQNISSFQPNLYSRKALFWSVLVGTDDKVRSLSDGYSTPLGGIIPTGLSRDTLQQFQLIRSVALEPRLLLVDLSECSYGKEFIDGFAKLLNRTHGRTTVLICGAGNALKALTDQSVDLPALNLEVAR
ncbi:MAG: ABC transporter transmembrane domain-containing protein [Prochlorococcaceae cyanobacterium]